MTQASPQAATDCNYQYLVMLEACRPLLDRLERRLWHLLAGWLGITAVVIAGGVVMGLDKRTILHTLQLVGVVFAAAAVLPSLAPLAALNTPPLALALAPILYAIVPGRPPSLAVSWPVAGLERPPRYALAA